MLLDNFSTSRRGRRGYGLNKNPNEPSDLPSDYKDDCSLRNIAIGLGRLDRLRQEGPGGEGNDGQLLMVSRSRGL